MRLLKCSSDDNFDLISFDDDNPPQYAILSHTWAIGEEVTYDELISGAGKDKPGYEKIRFCGDRAIQDRLQYFWVDTCCINKAGLQELQTAINSMFRYYQRASKCYVYLSDVQAPDEATDTWEDAFRQSRWFTRSWTLQELLAPPIVEFFSRNGKQLGSKKSLEQEIQKITQIPVTALQGHRLVDFSIEERMSWTARRTATFKEDKVYCLLGIFGVSLPLIYGEGEAHAALRLREEIQKHQEGRGVGHLQDLAVTSLLPFPRNELFTGREAELQTLEQFLLSNTHKRMTIYGLGGCGKSALALELAYRALARYNGYLVLWVPAISQDSFELAYQEIGIRLRIPGMTDHNANVKQLVKDVFNSEHRGRWLMIIDNADDSEVLMSSASDHTRPARLLDHLPDGEGGKIIFTARSRKIAEDLTQSSVLKLNAMGSAEARQLLMRRLPSNEETAVTELLELLAYLPLAIVQAAAFIAKNGMNVSTCVSLFRQAGADSELFSERFEDPSKYRGVEGTIAKTWHISFDQIRQQDPLAADILSFMACLDRINIPRSLLPPSSSLVQQTRAIDTLKSYAFLTQQQQTTQEVENEEFFDMHRLIHMASQWWLEDHDERTTWAAKAAARLQELVPHGGHERKDVWTAYLPHAIHITRSDGVLEETVKDSLLERIGECQLSLGQYAATEKTVRQLLTLREGRLGIEHEDTLTSMGWLALTLRHQGKYKEAELIDRRVLALREKVLGPEHADTLTSMGNLASILAWQGKYEEAESMHRLNFQNRKTVLGAEHPDTLTAMSNLARVLAQQGKYKEAESIEREQLELRKKVLGAEHPDTLTSMYCLAHVLASQHCYEESTKFYEKACAGYNATLGKDHPTTRECHQNYSHMLSSQSQDLLDIPSEVAPSVVGNQKGKGGSLSNVFRKIRLKSSKYHR